MPIDSTVSFSRHQLVLASQEHSKQEAKMIQLENDLETAKKKLQEREGTYQVPMKWKKCTCTYRSYVEQLSIHESTAPLYLL